MVNQPFAYPELNITAYRQLLAEQRLPAFVYHPAEDRCELIEVQSKTTVDLSERVPAAKLNVLLAVLRRAVATGESFVHRQEFNGKHYTCFGFISRENGKVSRIEGFLLPENATDEEQDYLFGRRVEDRDSFTGLYTKVAIKNYARSLLVADSAAPVVFCMIDLDYFKDINDTYGHEFGDEVILKTAEILRHAVSGLGVAGRFGGDEFFLVLHKKMSEEELRTFLLGFRTELMHAFTDAPQHLAVHCSVGVAAKPGNGADFETLFAKADRALYIAKQKGRNRYIIYREALHGQLPAAEQGCGEKTLRTALRIDDTMHTTEEGIDQLYRVGGSALPAVLREVCLAYEYDGAAVFEGEDLHLACECGRSTGLKDFSIIKTPAVAAMIEATGLYRVNLRQLHTDYLEDFHGMLESCGISTLLLYRIGSKAAPRGVLLLHAYQKDNTCAHTISDEQQHVLGMLAYVIGKTALK